jgi:hypothetical protein
MRNPAGFCGECTDRLINLSCGSTLFAVSRQATGGLLEQAYARPAQASVTVS